MKVFVVSLHVRSCKGVPFVEFANSFATVLGHCGAKVLFRRWAHILQDEAVARNCHEAALFRWVSFVLSCFTGGKEHDGVKILFVKVLAWGVTNTTMVLKFDLEVGNNTVMFNFVAAVRSFHSINCLANVLTH